MTVLELWASYPAEEGLERGGSRDLGVAEEASENGVDLFAHCGRWLLGGFG